MEMKIIDPTTKIISNKETVYNEPKKLPEDRHYINEFKETKETNTQYKSLNLYVNHQLKSAIPFQRNPL